MGELISWSNVAYGSDDWTVITSKKVNIGNIEAQSLIIRNTSGKERVVIYWYEVAGRVLINKSEAKLMQAIEAYRAPTSTAEIMAFSMEKVSEEQIVNSIENFMSTLNQIKVVNN